MQVRTRNQALLLVVPMAYTIFAFAMALGSTGFFELDELAHFMKSRDSWTDWRNLLDIWGRPLCTFYFAITAPFGIAASRCLAVVITCLTALGTVRLASLFLDEQPHRNALVWLLLFAQPMFLLQSFAVMTEMMLALVWVWALVMLSKGRVEVAGLLVGLGGLARPEGWFAILCWPVLLRVCTASTLHSPGIHTGIEFPGDLPRRRALIISVVLSITPCLLWWFAGWMAYRNAFWFVEYWPWAPRSPYGRTPFKFLLSMLVASGFWMIVPIGYGIRDLLRRSRNGLHARKAILVLVAPLMAIAAVHGTLGTLGLFGSLSLPRYFVIVAPMIAILAANGLCARRATKFTWSLVLLLSLAPIMILLLARQLPIPVNAQFRRMAEASDSARQEVVRRGADPGTIVAAHPYVYYRLNLPLDSEGHRRVLKAGGLQNAPLGTVIILENVIWEFDGFPGERQLEGWGYRLLKTWAESGDERRSLPILSSLLNQHVLSLVGDTARVQMWVKER